MILGRGGGGQEIFDGGMGRKRFGKPYAGGENIWRRHVG